MKSFKYFLYTLLLAVVVNGCSDDDFGSTDFVKTDKAPENVSALFEVTQDNTGLVTITPTADGAINFDVYFGDATTDPVNLDVGQSVEHVYEEGNYEVVIDAYSLTGKSASATLSLPVSFQPPQFGTDPIVENDATVSKRVNVTVPDDTSYAINFDVFFGEDGNNTPLTANIGGTVSYDYQEPGFYTITIVLKGAAIETTTYLVEDFEVTEILQPITPAPPQPPRASVDVISIFSEAYTDIGGTDYNPDWGQSNFGSSFAMFNLDGDDMLNYIDLSYQGVQIGAEIDLTSMEYLHMDIWTADLAQIRKFLINVGVDPPENVLSDLTQDGWTSFDIPLSAFTDQGIAIDNIHQLKFVSEPWIGGSVFIDNIYFWKTPTESIEMPIDFESNLLSYTWSGFGANDYGPIPATTVANPDPSGFNNSSTVVEIIKTAGAQTWAGASMNLSGPEDFVEGTAVTMNVWSPSVGATILFKMEDSSSPPDGNGNPSVVVEVQATTTVANAWEELSFDLTTWPGFVAGTPFDRIVLFPDFGNGGNGESFYFDDIEIASIRIPLNFEVSTLNYTWDGFGASDFGPIPAGVTVNPDMSGINVSGNVVSVEKPSGAQTWAGASTSLAGPTDFSGGTTIKMKVWSPTAGTTILFKMEDSSSPPDGNGNPSVIVEVQATTTVANGWEEMTFDLTTWPDFSTNNGYDRVVLFPNFGNSGTGATYYFDDIILTN